MSGSRSVSVSRQNRPVTYITETGEETEFGVVGVDEFEGENIRKIVFEPSSSNPWSTRAKKEKGYSLGVGTSVLEVVNPADIQRLVIDAGWQPKHVYAGYGGLEMRATYVDEDRQFVDPLEHDLEFWGERGQVGSMFPAVEISTSLYIGRISAQIQVGVYRLVCTNGMVARALNMPEYTFTHANWNISKIREVLSDPMALPRLSSVPEGQTMCSKRGLQVAVDTLKRYREAKASPEGADSRWQVFESTYKPLTTSTLYPWALDNYIQHLQYLASGLSSDTVNAGHLVNAYTSAINAHRHAQGNDRGMWASLWPMDRVIEATGSLGTIAEMFSVS